MSIACASVTEKICISAHFPNNIFAECAANARPEWFFVLSTQCNIVLDITPTKRIDRLVSLLGRVRLGVRLGINSGM